MSCSGHYPSYVHGCIACIAASRVGVYGSPSPCRCYLCRPSTLSRDELRELHELRQSHGARPMTLWERAELERHRNWAVGGLYWLAVVGRAVGLVFETIARTELEELRAQQAARDAVRLRDLRAQRQREHDLACAVVDGLHILAGIGQSVGKAAENKDLEAIAERFRLLELD